MTRVWAGGLVGTLGCRLRPCPQELIAVLDMDPLYLGGAVCLPLLPPARTGPNARCAGFTQTFP